MILFSRVMYELRSPKRVRSTRRHVTATTQVFNGSSGDQWNFRRLKVVNKAKIDFSCLVISDRWRDKSTRFSRLIWGVLSIQLRERPTKRTCFSLSLLRSLRILGRAVVVRAAGH